MIPISSSIEGIQTTFREMKEKLTKEDFHLGGGYKYDHGYFDKALDWEEERGNRYYLRIPVYAIDDDLDKPNTQLEIGRPFVIKHEFQTRNDLSGDIGVVTALVNQFQKPVPVDDEEIDEKWITRAQSVLQQIESLFASI